jgi:hypothetical protein
MKATLITTVLAAAAAALLSFNAQAADGAQAYLRESATPSLADTGMGKTRAQVKAELAEAIARGEVFVGAGNAYRRGYESAPFVPAPAGPQAIVRR